MKSDHTLDTWIVRIVVVLTKHILIENKKLNIHFGLYFEDDPYSDVF